MRANYLPLVAVFMAAPKTAGINNRAVPIYLRHADGRVQVDEEGKGVRDDQITAVAQAFEDWMRRGQP